MAEFDGNASATALIDEYENQFNEIDAQIDTLRRSLHDDSSSADNDENEPGTEHSDDFGGDSDI